MDTALLSKQQVHVNINNYFNRIVTRHIFKGSKPTPILASERAILNTMGSMMDMDARSNGLKTLGPQQMKEIAKFSSMSRRMDPTTIYISNVNENDGVKTPT